MPRKTIQKNLAYDTERQLYYAVFRQDGRRYTRTYRTREEAQAALEGNSCADRRLPGKDCTLGEWLTFWLEEVVARDRAESTLYAYRNMARCHVLPALGRIPLAELTPLRIQGYLYEKMNQGLSPQHGHQALCDADHGPGHGGAAGDAGTQPHGPGDAAQERRRPASAFTPRSSCSCCSPPCPAR